MGWLRSVGSIKIISLFCRILSILWGSFAKETYNFIDPTDRSHPIMQCRVGVNVQLNDECSVEQLLIYRALLQKRPIILRSLLIVATP